MVVHMLKYVYYLSIPHDKNSQILVNTTIKLVGDNY